MFINKGDFCRNTNNEAEIVFTPRISIIGIKHNCYNLYVWCKTSCEKSCCSLNFFLHQLFPQDDPVLSALERFWEHGSNPFEDHTTTKEIPFTILELFRFIISSLLDVQQLCMATILWGKGAYIVFFILTQTSFFSL